jgi:uncharacterized protein YndB with AHSA1/START domain
MDVAATRTFDVPIEQVWREWTEPERVKRWWGPDADLSGMDTTYGCGR